MVTPIQNSKFRIMDEDLTKFALEFVGDTTGNCIEAYARKHKIENQSVDDAFWNLVENGEISVFGPNCTREFIIIKEGEK